MMYEGCMKECIKDNDNGKHVYMRGTEQIMMMVHDEAMIMHSQTPLYCDYYDYQT